MNATAQELYKRIADVLQADTVGEACRRMHSTLVTVCHEGTKNSSQAFGNLFAQTDYLCREHHLSVADSLDVQEMRRHSNGREEPTREDLAYDARALALLVAAVCNSDVPPALTAQLPHTPRQRRRQGPVSYHCLRAIVEKSDERYIYLHADAPGDKRRAEYGTPHDGIDLRYLQRVFRPGMQVNLIDCSTDNDGTLQPRRIIVEPDYLIDISSIAGCFAQYGHHPFSYIMRSMGRRADSQPILLGNYASQVLDDIINNAEWTPQQSLLTNLHDKALEFASCDDFQQTRFITDAQQQAMNLKDVVDILTKAYRRDRMILEPTFVCEALGLQGRVDLMTTDLQLLVEQKSGKNIFLERNITGPHGNRQVETHYVQLLLYFGILQSNFGKKRNSIDIRLLYSKYPAKDGLMVVNYLQTLFDEALKFRNQLVSTFFWVARSGFDRLLPLLTEKTINEKNDQSNFYHQYLFPEIDGKLRPLHRLSPIEEKYFCRMMTFICREQLLSKVGHDESKGSADAYLWTMPLSEKRDAGNIYTDLTILRKERSHSGGAFDILTLAINDSGEQLLSSNSSLQTSSDDFLPNFRVGDSVLLYAYFKDIEPDVRKSILFKATITEMHEQTLTVCLADGQQNPHVLQVSTEESPVRYAIEHSTRSSAANLVSSLYEMITAPQDRRDLLLCRREPRKDTSRKLTRSYNPTYDDVLLRAKQASDYFLLIGPPGTGKTSMALRYMVEETLQTPQASLLLMAYTNRAVDEICGMLCKAKTDFLRIGAEYSCDERFRPYLLSARASVCKNREEVRSLIDHQRVIVGTTSMIQARSYLFNIKHFTLAIVDEASQILEPNIVGLLAAHRDGKTCIDKFILMGDYKQLPAVVQQSEEESAVNDALLTGIGLTNCRNSLFERLIRMEQATGRTAFTGILHRQGRMHPDIAAFPNSMFYRREQLEPVPLEHQLETDLHYDKPSEDAFDETMKKHRLLFVPSKECERPDLSDKVNMDEARIVASCLRRVYRQYGPAFDANTTVGVIVPYRNQIAMIRKEIEKMGIEPLQRISIDTVERYQGSQRDVIIYSFTVQRFYQLDFLTANSFLEDDRIIDRKLNVAITRARKQLILTGNERILCANPLFAELINYVKVKGGYSGME